MEPYPPPSVGPVAGREPPKRLPWVGVKVVGPGDEEGVVGHYEYYSRDQVWFPVNFWNGARRCKLGTKVSEGFAMGFVRLADPPAKPKAAS